MKDNYIPSFPIIYDEDSKDLKWVLPEFYVENTVPNLYFAARLGGFKINYIYRENDPPIIDTYIRVEYNKVSTNCAGMTRYKINPDSRKELDNYWKKNDSKKKSP